MSRRPNPFSSKLTLDDAERVRQDYEEGESVEVLAGRHGTTRNSIYEILRGNSHLPTIAITVDSATYAKLRALSNARGITDLAVISNAVVAAGIQALEETAE